MKDKFPIFKFANSSVEYQMVTEENEHSLAKYMQQEGLKRLIVISAADGAGWNKRELPNLDDFLFLEELSIHWTSIKDISGIHSCANLRALRLDNDDTTAVDFSYFPYIEEVVSWDRKNIISIWDVPSIRRLTLAGIKKRSFTHGAALSSIEKMRLLKTPIVDISFLSEARKVSFLELLDFSKVEDLSPLQTLTQLKHLRISANKVKDFSFLKHLVNLETLYISTKKGEFSEDCFSGLDRLRKVNLSGNRTIQEFNRRLQAELF